MALGEVEEEPPDQDLLEPADKKVDKLLHRLYRSDRQGGLAPSNPVSARWMGDIRTLFPAPVVRILQKDALDRFGIKKLLSQPAFLEEVEPDVGLIASILSVKDALPDASLATVRQLIRKLADRVDNKMKVRLIDRLTGRRDTQKRIHSTWHQDIDWHATIRRNLKHYQPSLQTIIPEQLVGHTRKSRSLKKVILLVDQSASMGESLVYSAILGAVVASVRTIKTHFVVFDTEVVDLTNYLDDPVELLLQSQLGGGTNIYQALVYATQLIEEDPLEATVVLLSDLYEGGPVDLLLHQAQTLIRKAAQVVVLLALDDKGTPAYDKDVGAKLAEIGLLNFAATPEVFPDLLAAALNREDLSRFLS